MRNLPGRTIEDAPYTGLIERLSEMSAVCGVVAEAPDAFDREVLLNFVVQLGELASEATIFAGATQEEAVEAVRDALGRLSFGKADQ